MNPDPTPTEQPKKKDPATNILKTGAMVAALTLLSKFIGLARDIIVSREYGTSIIADAFNYATLLTGNVLILFGGLGGPFHSSTVAILRPLKDQRESGRLITQVMVITALALAFITLVVYLVAPLVVQHMNYNPEISGIAISAGGRAAIEASSDLFLDANRALFQKQVLEQLNIMLPLIVISGIVGVSYGVLNVYNKNFWPSLSPALASIAIIVAIYCTDPRYRLITGVPLAVGTLAGALAQMFAQMPGMAKLNLDYTLTKEPHPGLQQYKAMLWPAVFSTSVGQLNVYVDSAFALMLNTQGAWTAVIQSNRLVQLPLGILLTAILVPMLPRFTDLAVENRHDDLKEELRRSLRFLWFVSLPVTVIFLVIPKPIIDVLFKRGNFDETSAALVATALVWLAPSIVFYVARDMMTRVFYAMQDSLTPYRVAIAAIGVKGLLDWFFVSWFQSVAGLSLATSMFTIFNLSMLTWLLKKKIGLLGFGKLRQPLLIMVIASIACGAVTFWLHHLGAPIVSNTSDALVANMHDLANQIPGGVSLWLQMLLIAAATGCGLLVYVTLCIVFHLDEPIMLGRRIPVVRNYIPNRS